jgi:hypothetical protein
MPSGTEPQIYIILLCFRNGWTQNQMNLATIIRKEMQLSLAQLANDEVTLW